MEDTEASNVRNGVERGVEVQRFSPEARKALEGKGFVVVELTGQSIASLIQSGRLVGSSDDGKYRPDYESPSRRTEVAFNPNQLFLPGSNDKTLDEQISMVDEFSRELSGEIPGVKVVIGDPQDYAELAHAYSERTGNKLSGTYKQTRTRTPVVDSVIASVSFPVEESHGVGLVHIGGLWLNSDVRDSALWVAPLVVPA